MTAPPGTLLVLGSGPRPYREYLLAAVARRAGAAGHDLWLVTGSAPTWERPYVAGWTVVGEPGHDRLVDAARAAAAHRPVVGLVCWEEALVVPGARLAAELGVPGLGVEGASTCRDRQRTRERLTLAGLAQPAVAPAGDAARARLVAARLGYPVVVKPRVSGGGAGVTVAAKPGQLGAALRVASRVVPAGDPPPPGGAVVERHLDGPEISIDAAVSRGECLPMFLARRRTAYHPHVEDVGHIVDAADPLWREYPLADLLTEAHRALRIENGVTHTVVRLTDHGPVVVEVSGRPGGDLLPQLAAIAGGIDVGAALVDVATGARPRVAAAHPGVAGIRFGYPRRDSRVLSVRVPAPDPVTGIVTSAALAPAGTELRLPPGGHLARHSYVLCRADDPDDCALRLRRAMARVRLVSRPIGPPPPDETHPEAGPPSAGARPGRLVRPASGDLPALADPPGFVAGGRP